jgi:hypothetical protein
MPEFETMRELTSSEVDQVAGGLGVTVGLGLQAHVGVNANDVFKEVNTLVGDVGSLVSGLVGGLGLGSIL